MLNHKSGLVVSFLRGNYEKIIKTIRQTLLLDSYLSRYIDVVVLLSRNQEGVVMKWLAKPFFEFWVRTELAKREYEAYKQQKAEHEKELKLKEKSAMLKLWDFISKQKPE